MPGVAPRLATLDLPRLVLWGECDGIVGAEYGRAYAEAIAGRGSSSCPTGHMPQPETPEQVIAVIRLST
jgi:pimeloyl-ACP methyl ester carboxylesterase